MGFESKQWLTGETIQAKDLNRLEDGVESAHGAVDADRLPVATATVPGAITLAQMAASRVSGGFSYGTYNGLTYSLFRTYAGQPIPGLVAKHFGTDDDPPKGAACIPVRETLASFAARTGATAAFNASGWKTSGNTGEIRGAQIRGGVAYHEFESFDSSPAGVDAIGFRADGTARTYSVRVGDSTASMIADGVVTSFSHGPILVREGAPVELTDSRWTYFLVEQSARTIIGVDSAGDLMVVTLEGSTSENIGLNAVQAMDLAYSLGFHEAILGDGGGSAQAQAGEIAVMPSSDSARSRPVVDALCVNVTLRNPNVPTPWMDCEVLPGYAANQSKPPQVKRDGNRVIMQRGVNNTGLSGSGSFNILRVPSRFTPLETKYMTISGSSATNSGMVVIGPDGTTQLRTGGSVSPYYLFDSAFWTLD